jgi:alginate O-acetyltransferase complex protein AlgI
MVVMGIGGLWHGASLNYLAWGVFHGTFLCIERFFAGIMSKTQILSFRPMQIFCGILYGLGVFVFVSSAWMFFKMPNFEMLCKFIIGAINNPWAAFRSDYFYILGVIYALPVLLQHLFNKLQDYRAYKIMEPALYAMMLFLAIVEAGPESAFIYFQF